VGYLAFLCLALSSVRVVKNRPALYVILAVLGLFTLVHMLTVSNGRYAQPLMPYVVLLAMKGLSRFYHPLAQDG
jgi:hypothetical protein